MMSSSTGRAANGRSTIYKDDAGRWHGYVSMGRTPAGRSIRRHVSARTQSELTRKVRSLETERAGGALTTPGRKPTLDGYLAQWIERRSALDVRPKTVAGYRTDARYVTAAIGGKRIDRVTSSDIEGLWTSMVQAGVVASIAHVRRTLNACLADAINEGLVARNPIKGARTPKHDSPKIEPYTVDEVRRFLATAKDRRNSARWTVAVISGLRQGEVLGLQWSDLDLAAATLTVRRQLQRRVWRHGCLDKDQCGKRGADCPQRWGGGLTSAEPKSRAGRRVIALPPSLTAELVEHRKAQIAERLAAQYWRAGDWVFTTEWGAAIDQRRDWGEFKAMIAKAGLREARLHDLRHSAATLMLEADTDLQTAGQILGHGAVSQTSKYTHILADRQRAAAARMESLIWGTPPHG